MRKLLVSMDKDIGWQILALFLRLVFIGALAAIAVRVSLPQSETLRSVYETPGDLVRLALGMAVCGWVAIHLFTLPKTVGAYKRWINLGLVVVPIASALAMMLWR